MTRNLDTFKAPYPLEGVVDDIGFPTGSFLVGKNGVTSITTDDLGVYIERSAPMTDVYITPCGFGQVRKKAAVPAPSNVTPAQEAAVATQPRKGRNK